MGIIKKILSEMMTYEAYLERFYKYNDMESVHRNMMDAFEIKYCNQAVKDGYMSKGHDDKGRTTYSLTRKGRLYVESL